MQLHIKVMFSAGVLLLLLQSPTDAVSPLTPGLTDDSRLELLSKLTSVGFPEVGQNSVLIALTASLGFEPKDSIYKYSEPYAHLPKVDAQATRSSLHCAAVSLVATYQPPAQSIRLHLRGKYCLVAAAKWSSHEQVITRE